MTDTANEPATAPAIDPTWRPYSTNVELTLACNLRCRHCGSSAGKPRPDELSTAQWIRVFSDLADLGGDEVCILGGEPLVRPDWEPLCRAVGDVGLGLVLITNGWRIDDEVVRILKGLGHLRRVGVSLDAADPAIHDDLRGRKGSHAKALTALWALRDAGIETGAITTVSRPNLGNLAALRDLLLGKDVTWQIQMATLGGARFSDRDAIRPLEFHEVGRFIAACRTRYPVHELPVAGSHDMGYFSREFAHVGELREWTGCIAGLYTLGILSDGRVKGCLSMHDDFIEDDLTQRPLADIWNDPERFRRNRTFDPSQLQGGCRGCEHGAVCRAGCANTAYMSTGSTFDNRFCFARIERENAGATGRGTDRKEPT